MTPFIFHATLALLGATAIALVVHRLSRDQAAAQQILGAAILCWLTTAATITLPVTAGTRVVLGISWAVMSLAMTRAWRRQRAIERGH
jgi:hypothetical protein